MRNLSLFAVLWTLAVLAVLVGIVAWYASTSSFQNRVRRVLIARLEKATGGRVELKKFSWRLTHLEFEADGLTIHGLEAPGQVPYAHIDRLFVRLQILSFFRAKIGLNYLEADHPVIHLIVYPDGSTNQPRPKHPSTGNSTDEIFNLAIGRTVASNGIAILNEEEIPFSLTANNLAAQVSYVPLRDRYVGTIHAEDIVAQRGTDTPVHSQLDASLDVGRNSASLVSLTLQSGPRGRSQKIVLRASGSLDNFNHPQWQFTMKGAIDALEIRALTGTPGLDGGTAQLEATGHGAGDQFAVDGTARISGGAYSTGSVHITGVTADAVGHVTQDLIAVTGIHARLASGGVLTGQMRIANWETPAPGQPTPKSAAEQGTIRTQLAGFTLDSLLDSVAPPHYRRLGFDTSAAGTANVDWVGDPANLTGSVNVTLAPPAAPHPDEVPVTGVVSADYRNRSGTVVIRTLQIHTPASEIQATGTLGVYPVRQNSQLSASLVTRNLAEFNPALATLGISAPGAPTPIPAQLHGEAQFHGTVSGSLDSPEFQGHLVATDFNILPARSNGSSQPAANIHFDSLTTDAAYSAGSLSVTAATLAQGKTTIQFSGEVRGRHDDPRDLFDDSSAIHATVQVKNADLVQWMAIAGVSAPVTGTLNLHVQTGGTIGDLNGGGQLSLTGGNAYGEPYRFLNTDLQFRGREVSANHLLFALDGGRIAGSGGYDLSSKAIHASLQGSGFELAHIHQLKNEQYPVVGSLDFDLQAGGTVDEPSLKASMHVRDLQLAREFKGFVNADAHTLGHALELHVDAHLNSSTLDLSSETQLTGNYQTSARLNIQNFNIDPLLRTFSVTGIRGSSDIDGAVSVSGPLKTPKLLNGDLRLSELAITLEDVPIHSDGSVHATLRNGVFQMAPLHILGPDTDVHTDGSIGLFTDPKPIHGRASGSVNMALAETLDTDLISSGHVDFTMNAAGTTKDPDLTGNVKFTNVNVAMEDYVNGLSRMNGQLVFDQDRLDFQNVTAYSGGGLIKVGGFVTYHRGLYGDLTATATDVRIRYPEGVTSTASASIHVQGNQASMLVSGTVTLTGFAINPGVDFASLAGSGGVSLPPNPSSPTNKVRLDIRVTSAPSLNFQNSFARLAGNVDLAIRGTLAQPTVLGRVTITEGAGTFNGEKFELQHGEIYFSNPVRIQPVLDLTATTTVENYTITISLQGTTTKINPTFRSEPPLSEQDIFSLLAMGRTQEEQQIYSSEQQQAGVNSTADSLLGGALNATLSNRIQKLFGGGSVKIDPTFVSGVGNATARITVQEPISKTATMTYATNVNSTAEQLIQGEWRMTPEISVVAVRDESGVFSLIFRLHRSYH